MTHHFRPSASSLIASFGWDVSPAVVAALGWHFSSARAAEKELGWLLLLLTGAMCLWSIFLILQTIVVHLKSISVDETGITVRGLGEGSLRYQDVAEAQLRERRNVVSRTDRLLMIRSNGGELLMFNPSTLRRSDEDALLSLLRKRIRITTVGDTPTL
jgi:hypothetical protein